MTFFFDFTTPSDLLSSDSYDIDIYSLNGGNKLSSTSVVGDPYQSLGLAIMNDLPDKRSFWALRWFDDRFEQIILAVHYVKDCNKG